MLAYNYQLFHDFYSVEKYKLFTLITLINLVICLKRQNKIFHG